MKLARLLTLAGLAIGFALPTFAQEKKDTVDPEVRQQIEALLVKGDEAFNKHDGAAFADTYSVHPLFAGATIKEYASKIKKTADGRWCSASSTTGGTQEIQPERRVEKDG